MRTMAGTMLVLTLALVLTGCAYTDEPMAAHSCEAIGEIWYTPSQALGPEPGRCLDWRY